MDALSGFLQATGVLADALPSTVEERSAALCVPSSWLMVLQDHENAARAREGRE
ncbi:hypothetical protein [Amycolatopsis sp. NPDC051071]|uniref:hypothetical protein n=1 Tax=Amycolatopsis sp. NPDC051071 TaxID=3154637 RepID=UPI00342EDC97